MSIIEAKRALLTELERESQLDHEEIAERLMPRFSAAEINAASVLLEGEGQVIRGFETDGRTSGIEFSFISLNRVR